MDRVSLALSRLWFAADLAAGLSAGSRCPNCDTRPAAGDRVQTETRHVFAVWECRECRLLFRPVGFTADRLMRLYYSLIYGNANLATDVEAIDRPESLQAAMGDRRRAHLLREVIGEPIEASPVVYVLGCSWGYEVWDLQRSGFRAVGIEISDPRRELGRRKLGLPLYRSVAEARRREPAPQIVMSSHVLEHVPVLTKYLDAVHADAGPCTHVHITPNVEPYRQDAACHRLIGREHPIGVTSAFWEHYARARGFAFTGQVSTYRPGEWAGELVAVMRTDGVDASVERDRSMDHSWRSAAAGSTRSAARAGR